MFLHRFYTNASLYPHCSEPGSFLVTVFEIISYQFIEIYCIFLFLFPALLRYNWHVTLCKIKVYNVMMSCMYSFTTLSLNSWISRRRFQSTVYWQVKMLTIYFPESKDCKQFPICFCCKIKGKLSSYIHLGKVLGPCRQRGQDVNSGYLWVVGLWMLFYFIPCDFCSLCHPSFLHEALKQSKAGSCGGGRGQQFALPSSVRSADSPQPGSTCPVMGTAWALVSLSTDHGPFASSIVVGADLKCKFLGCISWIQCSGGGP